MWRAVLLSAALAGSVLSADSEMLARAPRGLLQYLLRTAGNVCYCQCGIPNRDRRSLEVENGPEALQINTTIANKNGTTNISTGNFNILTERAGNKITIKLTIYDEKQLVEIKDQNKSEVAGLSEINEDIASYNTDDHIDLNRPCGGGDSVATGAASGRDDEAQSEGDDQLPGARRGEAIEGSVCNNKSNIENINFYTSSTAAKTNVSVAINMDIHSTDPGGVSGSIQTESPLSTTSKLHILQNDPDDTDPVTPQNETDSDNTRREAAAAAVPGAQSPAASRLAGDVPPAHEFPWLVLLLLDGKLLSGGALVTDKHVLTVASPIINAVPSSLKVVLGAHDRCNDRTASVLGVLATLVHPAYSSALRSHDVALVRMAATLRFDQRIHPICLPFSSPASSGELASVVSWGAAPCLPRRVRLAALPRAQCAAPLPPDHSCLGAFGASSGLGAVDVGAPVQYQAAGGRFELLGLLTGCSGGDDNATRFVRVQDQLPWLYQATLTDCFCSRF